MKIPGQLSVQINTLLSSWPSPLPDIDPTITWTIAGMADAIISAREATGAVIAALSDAMAG
jgi:hypothetical protein